jgi:hypothetical protein
VREFQNKSEHKSMDGGNGELARVRGKSKENSGS